jgi:hypothetical protein
MPKRRNHKGITYSGQATTHDTDGLKGYPAVDIFAAPGTPFRAPERGRIVRISGHPGKTDGNVFGQSIYFQGVSGRKYFITHLGSVREKGRYDAGSILGTVSAWSGGSSHAHVGWNDDNLKGSPNYAAIQTAGFWSGHGTDAPLGGDTGVPGGIPDQSGGVTEEEAARKGVPEFGTAEIPTDKYGRSVTQEPLGNPKSDVPFEELTTHDTWQTLADMPFSSPETQEWAARMRRYSA